MSTNDEYWRLRTMTGDRREPEIQPRVLVAKSCVPDQQVHCSIREEELEENNKRNHIHCSLSL